ncbi:MAG: metalloregulator ArsR/SmtB family transcription factor [Alphaproteobacteria bacterium]|nr:metalloregulator ArsR/SmtB family transcription factor [Alphaproteobacteria bacterium]
MPELDLVPFLKALADESRLRLVGLLALRPHSVEELATVLDLRASTVSHHLGKLVEAGLVRAEASGHYHVYALDLDALHARAKALQSREALLDMATISGDPYEQKVLSTFLDERGRLKAVPMKRKKFEVVLRHALRLFEADGAWSEAEINQRLKPLTDDVATLRRGFIDHGLMTRDAAGERYVRV